MLEEILRRIKKWIPENFFKKLQPIYHYLMALAAAIVYRFPGRKIFVVMVTGTKGKTSTIELVNAILEEAGHKTAILSTLRFKIGKESEPNKRKMTVPGRFFVQKFLRKAVNDGCRYAVLEMTSEGARQFRHKFIPLDALVFTNLSPEHIESHGSYENYIGAKLSIGKALLRSSKKRKILVVNKDDKESERFMAINVPEKYPYSLEMARPLTLKEEGLAMTIDGKEISSPLSGEFNAYNILAAATFAKSQGVDISIIKMAIEKFGGIPGRVEKIELPASDPDVKKQDFRVIVDYAHTADSLEKVYEVFQSTRKICVLGSTGGGRDKWKRPEMGSIADRHCDHIILTDEDPYDENPEEIVSDIKKGIARPDCEVIMDRRAAIREALRHAKTGDTVIITGKGTDPYIMGADGLKTPWSDAAVAREELKKVLAERL